MDALALLLRFIGEQLLRVRRVFFVHSGDVDRSAGPLELSFPNGTVLLKLGGDGATLVVTDEPWRDPFEPGPLSSENRAWIAEHGKWSSFDVSDDPDYRNFVGKVLTSIKALRTSGGNVCGVRMGFDSLTLDFAGTADEALVFLQEQNDVRLAEMKVYVGEEVLKKA